MKLESDGILIDMRPMGERDSLARVFSRDYGVVVGAMRGAQVAKKNRPLVGQFGAMAWNARLDSQLGVFHWDAVRNMSAPIMLDGRRLAMMNAAFGLIGALLPERERYDTLYKATLDMLAQLGNGAADATGVYIQWELELLRDVGYAVDLSSCAGCGDTDNLVFLSPRTCRAVCARCGAPYVDKLYRLPIGLDTTRHLISHVCTAQGIQIPIARQML